VHDTDRRLLEGRAVESLALDHGQRPGADFALEKLAIAVVVVGVRLQPQQVPDSHVQLGAVHRARQNVLGSGAESEQNGFLIGSRGDDDDRNVPGQGVVLEEFRHLESAEVRHHYIEQDQVRRCGLHQRQRFYAAAGRSNHEAVGCQHRLQQLDVLGFIVHDQDAGWAVRNLQ
jgi:hypothetical protein